MVIRQGIDIIEVYRIDRAILRHGERFFTRFFTEQELIDSNGRTPSLAARFAAKEAVSKALGCGIGMIAWREIEIIRDSHRKPYVCLHGAALALSNDLEIRSWELSMSHTHDHAVAFVTAVQASRSEM
ncbi:MAG TPA: holo-ACP synthase [Anaerolineales bacterium]|nr:holo-ACP synthase [Anaerolineales bacterium]